MTLFQWRWWRLNMKKFDRGPDTLFCCAPCCVLFCVASILTRSCLNRFIFCNPVQWSKLVGVFWVLSMLHCVIKFQFQYMCEHSEKASFYSTGFGVWSQNFKFLCSWFFSFELFFSLSNLGMCYSVSEQKMWMESWVRIPKLLECEWEMDLFLLFHLSSYPIYFFHAFL